MKLNDYQIFEFTSPLKPEHINFFEEHGFLHFRGVINEDTVALFKREMRAIETKWAEQNVEKVNGVPIKWGKDIDGRRIVQRFAFSSQHSDVLHEFIQDSRFTALFPLLGPHAKNPRMGENEKDGLVINHYINIDSSNFSRLGWHTDSLRDVFYGKRIIQFRAEETSPSKNAAPRGCAPVAAAPFAGRPHSGTDHACRPSPPRRPALHMSGLTLFEIALIGAAAFAAGAVNSVAGGGTFFSFPALLAIGVPPVVANASNSVSL